MNQYHFYCARNTDRSTNTKSCDNSGQNRFVNRTLGPIGARMGKQDQIDKIKVIPEMIKFNNSGAVSDLIVQIVTKATDLAQFKKCVHVIRRC